jgi:hypothetical protein
LIWKLVSSSSKSGDFAQRGIGGAIWGGITGGDVGTAMAKEVIKK